MKNIFLTYHKAIFSKYLLIFTLIFSTQAFSFSFNNSICKQEKEKIEFAYSLKKRPSYKAADYIFFQISSHENSTYSSFYDNYNKALANYDRLITVKLKSISIKPFEFETPFHFLQQKTIPANSKKDIFISI